jgi:hypothetical protein
VGEIEMETTGAGCTVTVATAVFAGSATDVAVTVKLLPADNPAV